MSDPVGDIPVAPVIGYRHVPADEPPRGPVMPVAARVLLFVAVYVVLFWIALLVEGAGAALLAEVKLAPSVADAAELPELNLLRFALQFLLTAVLIGLFWITVDRRSWPEFRLTFRPARCVPLWVALGAVLALVEALYVVFGTAHWGGLVRYPIAFLMWRLFVWGLMALLFACIHEGGLRGYVLPNLAERYGPMPAVVATAVIGLVVGYLQLHRDSGLLILDVLLVHVGAGFVRVRTRSLGPAILMNAGQTFMSILSTTSARQTGLFIIDRRPPTLWLGTRGVDGVIDVLLTLAWLLVVWKLSQPRDTAPLTEERIG